MHRRIVKSYVGLLIFAIPSVCFGQFAYYEKIYDFGDPLDSKESATALIHNGDSLGAFVCSNINYEDSAVANIALFEVNETGDTTFALNYGEADKAFLPMMLVRNPEIGIIVTARVTDLTTLDNDFSLFKVNSNQQLEFINSYGYPDKREKPFDLIKTSDSGFLIVGQSVENDDSDAHMYAVKTDSLGNIEWDHYYGGSDYEGCYSAIQAPDNGYYILGWSESYGPANESDYLVKIDSLGNQQWQQSYGSNSINIPVDILYVSDGNYLITGASGANGNSNGTLRKINPSGSTIWSHIYQHENNPKNNLWKTVELSDGSLISAGMTHVTHDMGWLMKTDANGAVIWSRMYESSSIFGIFYDLIRTDDGGFLMCGSIYNENTFSQDAWLLKVDNMGCTFPNCTVGLNELGNREVLLDVWPNPASDILNLEWQSLEAAELRLINQMRQAVLKRSGAKSYREQIDVSDLPGGVYFLEVVQGGSKTVVKVVVQH